MHWHPDTLTALGKLRAEELIREAAESRAAWHAIEYTAHQRRQAGQSRPWWRFSLWGGRAESAPLAQPDKP